MIIEEFGISHTGQMDGRYDSFIIILAKLSYRPKWIASMRGTIVLCNEIPYDLPFKGLWTMANDPLFTSDHQTFLEVYLRSDGKLLGVSIMKK